MQAGILIVSRLEQVVLQVERDALQVTIQVVDVIDGLEYDARLGCDAGELAAGERPVTQRAARDVRAVPVQVAPGGAPADEIFADGLPFDDAPLEVIAHRRGGHTQVQTGVGYCQHLPAAEQVELGAKSWHRHYLRALVVEDRHWDVGLDPHHPVQRRQGLGLTRRQRHSQLSGKLTRRLLPNAAA